MINVAKCLLRFLLRLLYKVEVSGMEHYEKAGNRVLIVANHTSLLDGLLLYAWLPETPTFAINTNISKDPKFYFFLKFVDLFPRRSPGCRRKAPVSPASPHGWI